MELDFTAAQLEAIREAPGFGGTGREVTAVDILLIIETHWIIEAEARRIYGSPGES